MAWTRLSDDFGDDCWTLSDAAFRLHVEGLAWSNRKLLDLRIPTDDVRRFAKHPGAVDELLAVGWWIAAGGAYLIRHHATYQRTRADVLALQEKNAANGRKGGRPKKPPREQVSDLSTETQSVSQAQSQQRTEEDRQGQVKDWPGQEEEHAHEATDEREWSGSSLHAVFDVCPDCSWPLGSEGHHDNCLRESA